MLRRIFWVLVLYLLFTISVNAQNAVNATLYPPETDAFPTIGAYLDVHDAQGEFIHNIQISDIRFFEDDHPVEINEFKKIRPGVQVVVALNPGRSFLIRNSKGLSRYDIIANTLTNWALSRSGSNLDDLSLIVPDSPGRTHLSDPLELAQATSAYIVNQATANPNLDLISAAIDVANDPTPRMGMERVILLFSSLLEENQPMGIQDLVTRAARNHTRIFVWLVGDPESFNEKNTALLSSLANQTGGAFIAYSTDDMAINLEDYLEPLRNIYYLEYESPTREAGTHQLFTQIQIGDALIKTPLQNFEIKINPPQPTFIMPPPSISRQAPPVDQRPPGSEISPKDYLPKEIPLQLLVEFPDGRDRPLVRSSLYIDRVIVAENQKPPFDQFTWDISKYTQSSQHLIQVEVEDTLGLVGSSIETPIDIFVPTPQVTFMSKIAPHLPTIAGLLAVGAGLLLVFVLLVNGKIRPKSHGWLKGFIKSKGKKQNKSALPPINDITNPAGVHLPDWTNIFQKQTQMLPNVLAYLTPTGNGDEPQDLAPLPIDQDSVIVGRDILQANLVLDDPTVEPVHARLTRHADNYFYIADQGTLSGTWVNYTPISTEGTRLEHGDLVHIGSVTFHFSQPDQSSHKKIIIQEACEYDPF
ncbi:MAG: FHA domain-containing protein [Anaerolineales bacterium]|nr:FHA domain-containing protein [Anaerolineales bacterium]